MLKENNNLYIMSEFEDLTKTLVYIATFFFVFVIIYNVYIYLVDRMVLVEEPVVVLREGFDMAAFKSANQSSMTAEKNKKATAAKKKASAAKKADEKKKKALQGTRGGSGSGGGGGAKGWLFRVQKSPLFSLSASRPKPSTPRASTSPPHSNLPATTPSASIAPAVLAFFPNTKHVPINFG